MRQRVKYQYTVCQGGKSLGSIRHAPPARTWYRIALTISRIGQDRFAGRQKRSDRCGELTAEQHELLSVARSSAGALLDVISSSASAASSVVG